MVLTTLLSESSQTVYKIFLSLVEGLRLLVSKDVLLSKLAAFDFALSISKP